MFCISNISPNNARVAQKVATHVVNCCLKVIQNILWNLKYCRPRAFWEFSQRAPPNDSQQALYMGRFGKIWGAFWENMHVAIIEYINYELPAMMTMNIYSGWRNIFLISPNHSHCLHCPMPSLDLGEKKMKQILVDKQQMQNGRY